MDEVGTAASLTQQELTTEERAMPIYQTAHYQIRPEAVDRVKRAIGEFVRYVTDNEPGSRLYSAWQQALTAGPVIFTDYHLVAANTP